MAALAAKLDPREVLRHTIRHTATTDLMEAGVKLPTVKKISGHKSWIVMRYAYASDTAKAMKKLEKYRSNKPEDDDGYPAPV